LFDDRRKREEATMNTVAIVKVIWITTVFATSALVSQALVDGRNPGPILAQQGKGAPSDAGIEPPRGYAIVSGEVVVAWSSWDATL
jgi:hypothetical protein